MGYSDNGTPPSSGGSSPGGSGLIGGAIGAITGLFNAGANRKNAKAMQNRQFGHNREMADLEWTRNNEMWDKQNQYNSPAQQMARLKEGGLNPHLMYGQGNTGNASQMPKYQVDKTDMQRLPALQLPDVTGAYQSLIQQKAGIDLTKEQVKLAKKDQELKTIEAINNTYGVHSTKAKAFMDNIMAQYFQDYQKKGLEKIQTGIEKDISDIATNKVQRSKLNSEKQLNDIDIKYAKKNKTSRLEPQALRTVKEIIEQLGARTPKQIKAVYEAFQNLQFKF